LVGWIVWLLSGNERRGEDKRIRGEEKKEEEKRRRKEES
jgi:hypothetical protein